MILYYIIDSKLSHLTSTSDQWCETLDSDTILIVLNVNLSGVSWIKEIKARVHKHIYYGRNNNR